MSERRTDSTKYIVDVPNYDKDGNDVSGHHPRGGGRRRKDGTLETSTDNYVPLDEYKGKIREEIKEELRAEIKEEVRNEVRDELDYEQEYSYYSYEESDDEDSSDSLEKITELFDAVNDLAEFLQNNPEIVEGVVRVAGKLKNGVVDGFWRLKNAVQKKHKSEHTKSTVKKEKTQIVDNDADEDKCFEVKDYVDEESLFSLSEIEVDDAKEDDTEEILLTDEEAKIICLRMVKNYIEIRRDYETLRKARMVDAKQLSDMLQKLEDLVDSHPKLLEEDTTKQIRNMLEGIPDEIERRRLLQLFQMNV